MCGRRGGDGEGGFCGVVRVPWLDWSFSKVFLVGRGFLTDASFKGFREMRRDLEGESENVFKGEREEETKS